MRSRTGGRTLGRGTAKRSDPRQQVFQARSERRHRAVRAPQRSQPLRGHAEPASRDAPARRGRVVVITGDTAPAPSVVAAAEGADVLVHEATFLADERQRARETAHSTAGEAALVAREAGVELLALTHVSTRYFGHQVVEEATQLFPATVVPRDFDLVTIPFPERGRPELVRSGARVGQPVRTNSIRVEPTSPSDSSS